MSNDLLNLNSNKFSSNRRFSVELEVAYDVNKDPRYNEDEFENEESFLFDKAQDALQNYFFEHKWDITEDSSIKPFGVEVIPNKSHQLRGEEGLKETLEIVNSLKEEGFFTNDSCGLHVHVDASDLKPEHIMYIFDVYKLFEKYIDLLVAQQRRENKSEYSKTLKDIEPSYERTITNINFFRNYVKNLDRYFKLNVTSFGKHGTIEFRQHQGTMNSSEIRKWVTFCVNFVDVCVKLYKEAKLLGRTENLKDWNEFSSNVEEHKEDYKNLLNSSRDPIISKMILQILFAIGFKAAIQMGVSSSKIKNNLDNPKNDDIIFNYFNNFVHIAPSDIRIPTLATTQKNFFGNANVSIAAQNVKKKIELTTGKPATAKEFIAGLVKYFMKLESSYSNIKNFDVDLNEIIGSNANQLINNENFSNEELKELVALAELNDPMKIIHILEQIGKAPKNSTKKAVMLRGQPKTSLNSIMNKKELFNLAEELKNILLLIEGFNQ